MSGQAATLFNNGAINNTTFTTVGTLGGGNPCDSVCTTGGSSFTIFDNFTVGPAGWVVTGFDFSDFLVGTSTPQTQQTVTWSLFSGDPVNGGGSLVKSGTSVANLSQPVGYDCTATNCLQLFKVDLGASVTLTGGKTYFLGTSVTPVTGYSTYRATTQGAIGYNLGGWEQSNGSFSAANQPWSNGGKDYNLPGSDSGVYSLDSSFDILGTIAPPVPEPSTFVLMGLALAGVAGLRRRSS